LRPTRLIGVRRARRGAWHMACNTALAAGPIHQGRPVMIAVRSLHHLLPALLVATLGAACATDESEDDLALTGNGAPSGPHFGLNIIGVAKDKSPDLTGGDGHRIFVPLAGRTRINLSEGDFAVLDANGTDGSAAFQLPNPDPDGDGVTSFRVFARALGKPGGSAKVTTCATDPTTGELVCSTDSLLLVRTKGKQTFTDVSKQLLFITADINGDGVVETVPLFDSSLQGFLWDFDNTGLRLAQLRFYQVQ
jgi:hypothetical protein